MKYLFPAIDLKDQQVVRLYKGDYDQKTVYGNDPLAVAQSFAEAGATWLHLVDLDGAKTGEMIHLDIIRSICENTSLKLEVGGGIRSTVVVDQLLDAGVTRVVIGSAAMNDWDWFSGMMDDEKYHHRLVLGLDARKGKIAIHGWQDTTDVDALDIAKKVRDWPLAAIVFTDIATDGTLQGPNAVSTQEMAEATKVPVVASGGVGTLEHLEVLRKLDIQGAIVGRALYDHAFTIDEALKVFEG